MVVIPEGFSQVNLRFTGLYVPTGAEVVFGVANTVAESPAVIAGGVLTAINTSTIMGNSADGVTLDEILVKNGPSETGPSAVLQAGIVGTASGSGIAPNVSYLLTKITLLGGRRGRGRSYWPGPTETDVDGQGVLASSRVTALQADATAFLAALSLDQHPMVLLHGPETEWVLEDGQPRRVPVAGSTPPAPTAVESWVVAASVATQRRRLRR